MTAAHLADGGWAIQRAPATSTDLTDTTPDRRERPPGTLPTAGGDR